MLDDRQLAEAVRSERAFLIASLPEAGLSLQVATALGIGVMLVIAGVCLESAIVDALLEPKLRHGHDEATVMWFQVLPLTAFIFGVFGIIYSLIDLRLRFEFFVADERFYCARIWGPFRELRSWPVHEILGTQVRLADAEFMGKSQSRLCLVKHNGQTIVLVPPRPTEMLSIPNSAINQHFTPYAWLSSEDRPPLGGGVSVSATQSSFQISAFPISPRMVPGHLYTVGGYLAFVNPIFSIGLTAVVKDSVAESSMAPVFWYCMIGQLVALTVAGIALRRWIADMASRRYEITIAGNEVNIALTSAGAEKSQRVKIADIGDVRYVAIVSEKDASRTRAIVSRVELVTDAKKPVEVLLGRPVEETMWVTERLRRAFNLPPEGTRRVVSRFERRR